MGSVFSEVLTPKLVTTNHGFKNFDAEDLCFVAFEPEYLVDSQPLILAPTYRTHLYSGVFSFFVGQMTAGEL